MNLSLTKLVAKLRFAIQFQGAEHIERALVALEDAFAASGTEPMCKHGYTEAHACKNPDHPDCVGCPGPALTQQAQRTLAERVEALPPEKRQLFDRLQANAKNVIDELFGRSIRRVPCPTCGVLGDFSKMVGPAVEKVIWEKYPPPYDVLRSV